MSNLEMIDKINWSIKQFPKHSIAVALLAEIGAYKWAGKNGLVLAGGAGGQSVA